MKIDVEVQAHGEGIISATIDMDEKTFFSLKYDDELEIDFDDPKTEFNFCVWYKEPLTGRFGFEISEIDNHQNEWHCEKREEREKLGEAVGYIKCMVLSF